MPTTGQNFHPNTNRPTKSSHIRWMTLPILRPNMNFCLKWARKATSLSQLKQHFSPWRNKPHSDFFVLKIPHDW